MQNETALITLVDEREEWAERFKRATGIDVLEHQKSISLSLADVLNKNNWEVLNLGDVSNLDDALSLFREIGEKITSLIIHIPGWTHPNIGQTLAILSQKNDIPILLWGSSALSGVMPTKGAIEDASVNFTFVLGLPEEEEVKNKILNFLNAAKVYKIIQNKKLGVFGGVSMGIYSYFGNFLDYKKFLGIDTVHFEEEEILKEKINEKLVDKYFKFLKDNLKEIKFDGDILTEEKLKLQISAYLGIKEIIKRNKIDMVNIKCIPNFCNNYINPCLIPTFLNDVFDPEGEKEIIPTSCEGDTNSCVCMEILKDIKGEPVFVGDVMVQVPAMNLLLCCACGGAAMFFSKRSKNYKENLKEVSLYPQIQGKAGGGAIEYLAEKEDKVTVCSLRKKDNKLEILTTSAFIEPNEVMKKFLPSWPHIHLKMNNLKNFLGNLSSQHICIVRGDLTKELEIFCKITGIKYQEV